MGNIVNIQCVIICCGCFLFVSWMRPNALLLKGCVILTRVSFDLRILTFYKRNTCNVWYAFLKVNYFLEVPIP